jgi:5-methylthioadenosine/S-adenosylhomocysteine deaminase
MARTLIRNGYVVTVDAGRAVHPGGFVAIDGPRITAVGPAAATPQAQGFDEVIDARGCMVMPGLVNMHQHHWYTLFKGLADGMLLEDWVTDLLLPLAFTLDAEAMRVSSSVAALEMLATGTTCSLNHSVTTTTPEIVRASIEPQAEIGIRQVFAKELRCNTPGNPRHPLSLDQSLAAFEEEFRRWDGKADGRVRMAMVIESNAHWVAAGMSTEALITRGYQLAGKLGARISAHIAGGTFSLEKGFLKYLRETGRTDVRYLMQLGILDKSWILAHCIHNTELDLEQMAHVGASLVYTPTSESIRGGGIGPAAAAMKAGVLTTLGTDGPMVDYSVDMVEQMKTTMLMQHVRHLDPTRIPVETAVEMATINGARALGLEAEIGSLEAGKRADIAIFDMAKPHIGVMHRPLSTFVTAGNGSDAKWVLVDGEVVYREGRFPRCADPMAVVAEAERIARGVLAKAGLSGRLDEPWRVPVAPLRSTQ